MHAALSCSEEWAILRTRLYLELVQGVVVVLFVFWDLSGGATASTTQFYLTAGALVCGTLLSEAAVAVLMSLLQPGLLSLFSRSC